jgi:hypothetical protein
MKVLCVVNALVGKKIGQPISQVLALVNVKNVII